MSSIKIDGSYKNAHQLGSQKVLNVENTSSDLLSSFWDDHRSLKLDRTRMKLCLSYICEAFGKVLQ